MPPPFTGATAGAGYAAQTTSIAVRARGGTPDICVNCYRMPVAVCSVVRQAPGMQLLRHRPSGLPVVLAAGHRDLRPLRPGPAPAGPLARRTRLRHLLHRCAAPPHPVRLLRSGAAAGQPARPGRRHLRQLRRAARQQRMR